MGPQALEKFRQLTMPRWGMGLAILFVAAGCSSKFLKVEDPKKLEVDDEFSRSIQIVVPEEAAEGAAQTPTAPVTELAKPAATPVKGKAPAKPGAKAPPKTTVKTPAKPAGKTPSKTPAKPAAKAPVKGKAPAPAPVVHEPDLEDGTGFVGRRPLVDPFRVGEKVVHDVSYFKLSAGELTMQVGPYAMVNGKKAYNFITAIETYPKFSSLVYAVQDKAVTLLDFDTLVPRVFTLHVKETGQIKEARSIFDFDTLRATYWEKKVTEKNGAEEKKLDWEILPYSQNVFSAIFYMRLFKWEAGKEYSFRVADDGENIVFKGKAVRREVLETDVGTFPTVVVKPEITVKGVFKPMGDIFIWLTDDDRRLVLRIESKIKIGTLVSEVVRIEAGRASE